MLGYFVYWALFASEFETYKPLWNDLNNFILLFTIALYSSEGESTAGDAHSVKITCKFAVCSFSMHVCLKQELFIDLNYIVSF